MPAFSVGKSKRENQTKTINVPGPGSYSQAVDNIIEHSPSWTMSSIKKPEINHNLVPGPGAYNNDMQAIKVLLLSGKITTIYDGLTT